MCESREEHMVMNMEMYLEAARNGYSVDSVYRRAMWLRLRVVILWVAIIGVVISVVAGSVCSGS